MLSLASRYGINLLNPDSAGDQVSAKEDVETIVKPHIANFYATLSNDGDRARIMSPLSPLSQSSGRGDTL